MFWFDWMTLGIILVFAILQAVHASRAGGFGVTLFQGLLVCLAVAAAVNLAPLVAPLLKLERGIVLTGLFVLLGVAAWLVGRMLFSFTGWSLGGFDVPLGFLFGAVAGWAVAHLVLRILIEFQGPGGPVGRNLAQAPVAAEIYWFGTWNRVLDLLFRTREGGGREMWNVDQHGM